MAAQQDTFPAFDKPSMDEQDQLLKDMRQNPRRLADQAREALRREPAVMDEKPRGVA